MPSDVQWHKAIQPLLKKYRTTKHPLDYQNHFQLLVMVVLSAQSTDVQINKLAPAFFDAYPTMQKLSKANAEDLYPYISKVRNYRHKADWLVQLARRIKKDNQIPLTLEELDTLPGIGRKSANVILREAGKPPQGVIVDLHVVRVAPRLGITDEGSPAKIEKQIMEQLPQKDWDAGMAMSFLGREICRPKPQCEICLMRKVCAYYQKLIS